MVKLLFKDVATTIYLNECITKLGGLRRGALYSSLPLSYCMGSLEFHVQKSYKLGDIKEITMWGGTMQQIIS